MFSKNYPGYGSGISPDTIYVFDQVFCISNGLWDNETIAVDLTVASNSDGVVTLYSPSSIENRSPNDAAGNLTAIIPPGQQACIGFVINTTGYVDGDSYQGVITIHGYRYP